jgi:hypothetical protein
MILKRGDASNKGAISLCDLSDNGFEANDPQGVGDAHSPDYSIEPLAVTALRQPLGTRWHPIQRILLATLL